jgi:hypothetical protein
MGKLNKFFYVKGTAKRDLLIAADRINGVIDTDGDTLVIQFDNLSNDRSSDQGTISFDITSGEAKEFLEDLFSASAKNPFTVIADDITATSASSRYAGGAVAITDQID